MNNTFPFLPKSFSAKIFFFLIVSIVCIVSVFNIVLINIQKKNYKSSYDAYGATLIRLLAHSIRVAVFAEDPNEMLIPVSGLLQQDDVFKVIVWNKDREVLLQQLKDSTRVLPLVEEPLKVPTALIQDDKSDYLIEEHDDSFILWGRILSLSVEENWYFDEERKDSGKEIIGYAAIILSKVFFEKGVRNILMQTGVSVLILLLVIILTTFLIIQNVTEPLRKLVLTIRKREGNTNQPSDLKVLTETYTNMLDDLERSFQTISELNEGLEEKVKVRTAQLTEVNEELKLKQEKLKNSNAHLVEALRRLKETQEQLIQKEKLAAIGQLVAGVAHELNNTINFISGALPSLHRSFTEMKEVLAGYEEVEKARGSSLLDEKFHEVNMVKEKLAYEELFLTIDQLMENIEEG
ncbi:MAG: hypothetical protein D3908_10905, partial [Candidatus Electrothrix sp. AUS4]|nr:hypothetical protein [Candidatus Electrothrix sp. AUS4]